MKVHYKYKDGSEHLQRKVTSCRITGSVVHTTVKDVIDGVVKVHRQDNIPVDTLAYVIVYVDGVTTTIYNFTNKSVKIEV